MLSNIIIFCSYIIVASLAYFVGVWRKKDDINKIHNTINKSLTILLKESNKNFKNLHDSNKVEVNKTDNLLLAHNSHMQQLIEHQVEAIRGVHDSLKFIQIELNVQRDLYEKIATLQKIITKKKQA